MSFKSSRNLKYIDKEKDNNLANDDDDSIIELGEIAILGSSKASLRYKSVNQLNLNRKEDLESIKFISDKMQDIKQVSDKQEKIKFIERLNYYNEPYKGYIFGILSAFLFCLSQVILKRAKWLSGSDHSTIRYLVTFVVMFIVIKYKEMSLMGPKKQFNVLLLRGFVGSCALITMYFALMMIIPSDVTAIAHTSIIITAIMARLFLKEKLTVAHLFSLVFTIIGVIFISKPSFLFKNQHVKINAKNVSLELNCTNLTLINGALSYDCDALKLIDEKESIEHFKLIIGVILTFLGSFFISVVFLVLKKLSNSKVHWANSTISVTWFGLPFSIIISVILVKYEFYHKNFSQERLDLPMDIFYSILASFLSLSGQISLNIAFKFEDTTKLAIVKTIDVFFSFILQFLFLNILVDPLSIIGAVCILTGTFCVLVFKLLENKYEVYKKKQQNKEKVCKMDEIVVNNQISLNNQTDNSEKSIMNNDNGSIETKSSWKNFILKLIFYKF